MAIVRVIGICLLGCIFAASGADAAKYAGEAFSLGGSARSLGFGGAYVALADDPSALYYNPAGLARIRTDAVILLHSETFGSLLNHDFLAYAHPARLGTKQGALAVGVYRLAGGGIKLTEWDPATGRPIVVKEVGHYDYLLMFGGGFTLNKRLRAGAAVKVILRGLGENSAYGLGLDLGMQYSPLVGADLAIALTNATSSFLSYDNGTRESILPAVKVGVDLHRQASQFSFRFVADGEILFEGRKSTAQFWLGKTSLDTRFGGEIGVYNLLFFRAGSDVGRLSLGFGIKLDRFGIDGAFANHDNLDNSFRVSVLASF